MCALSPDEENLLRGLEEQLRKDAPRLARALRPPPPSALNRWAPTLWPPRVWVTIGVVFLVAGMLFAVGSSAVAGLVSLGLAKLRSVQLTRARQRKSGGQQDSPHPHR
jgi:hypothetical protein